MTSLNGDAFVMRNGRSTSQVSIYNYPEHLNPFYEDEQHKRLRFWKINKSNNGSGRRNSFSLGGLKDVWTFKSFRLKKKSSTLGINKTSESPPPLRRDLQPYNTLNGNDLSLPDYRTRYSTPAGVNESFQRNAAYRSSLQNVASAKDNGDSHLDFNRNNQYRSTIQVMGTKSNNHNNSYLRTTPVPQPRRSSQISMASTNPFETDDDDEENNEDVSLAGDREMITSTPIKQRIHRKKRRAPAPPTIGVNKTYSSADSSLDMSQPPQPLPELRIEECMDIANLTAAIENFVKTTNEDTAETPTATTNQQTEHEQTSSTVVIKENGVAKPIRDDAPPSSSHGAPETTEIADESVTVETKESLEADSLKVQLPANQPQSNKEQEVGHVECIHVHTGTPQTPTAAKRSNEANQLTSFRSSQTRSPEPKQPITAKTSFTLTTPPATRRDSTKKAKITLHTTEPLKFPETDELRITEDTTTPRATTSPSAVKPAVATKPHVAEIHKPARGITSTTTIEHKEILREHREPPISPVPPVRQSTLTKHTQKTMPKEAGTEKSLNIVTQNTESTVEPEAVPTTSATALTITESHEDLLEREVGLPNDVKNSAVTNETATAHQTQSTTELREEVLESLYRPKPTTSYMEWKKSSLAPLEKNVPPEKRKSVKDIIESINRSQRLLNASAHKDTAHNGSSLSIGPNSVNGTPLPQRKFSGPSAVERNLAREIQHTELNGNSTASGGQNDDLPTTSTAAATPLNDNVNGDGSGLAQDPQKLNNNEIFKKCTVKKEVQYDYREQSPTTSNLDWNPVPKPKRNKNLSEQ
ncbi:probable serine/threonine-protein kinase nek3 isoform X2 [Bactrocera neohumeralis]|uniref:probable serine/threonine-protein kinase nek3 isoform X2 n=1 Tax=Bactrocera neohumeralis TaxID=98809 RepID=UPI0021656657|nr:probable serine/threonine-protein kinase nek3 isoform X2 [Bactrocera neohumeralis]